MDSAGRAGGDHAGPRTVTEKSGAPNRERMVTDEVVASFAGAGSDRYRAVMTALVRHLHAFAREVRLTESEWQRGIKFLTRCGHLTTDTRQEFVLASDVLGLSMLTVAINAPASAGATEPTVLGPFFVAGAPEFEAPRRRDKCCRSHGVGWTSTSPSPRPSPSSRQAGRSRLRSACCQSGRRRARRAASRSRLRLV